MRVGYACINTQIGCTSNSTFRLKSYSNERLSLAVENNLGCLYEILKWNKANGIRFFRIGSQLVPFASHPVCRYNWRKHFRKSFEDVGDYIMKNRMRVTMHPDQFVVINSGNPKIVEKSVDELVYHCDVLDLMGLDAKAKVVVHVGGVYGDKKKSMQRFVENYKRLPGKIKKRLVVENDERSYSVGDCLAISREAGVPVVVDNLHHECLNNRETIRDCVAAAGKTWERKDGRQILHYSEQKKGARMGSHSTTISVSRFKRFLDMLEGIDFDVMLEVKDKEQSALKAA